MIPATLVLFSGSYPYSEAAEETFIGPELPHLLAEFDRVILVPGSLKGERAKLPPHVEVDTSYAAIASHHLSVQAGLNAVTTVTLYRETFARPATLLQPRALGKVFRCAGNAARTTRWMSRFAADWQIEPRHTVFYSYWLTTTTLGVSRYAAPTGGVMVSRAHGGDLYHERHLPPYIPCHAEMLRGLDALFLACENAKLYIQQRFPQDVPDCEVWHLGVPQPSRINHASSDAVFRLVSCSYLVPVKRVELLLEAVAEVGRLHPEQQIDWKHFGGGPEEERLRSLASRVPANVSCHWYGSVPNDEIRRHYENHPVDLFATVTASEGGVPVSIMEAQSFGIPVLATDVGGIRDIITRENGILVDGAHGPVEIADALAWFISGRQNAGAMRDASRRICREDFDSQKNFQRFAVRLRSMIR